jgi:hypothetical protein
MALFNRRLLMVCAALLVAGVTSCATHTATQTRTARIEVVPVALTQP